MNGFSALKRYQYKLLKSDNQTGLYCYNSDTKHKSQLKKIN